MEACKNKGGCQVVLFDVEGKACHTGPLAEDTKFIMGSGFEEHWTLGKASWTLDTVVDDIQWEIASSVSFVGLNDE